MTLLPLDAFRRILSYNPWHFAGLYATSGPAALASGCNEVVKQYAWQNAQAAGRHEVEEALIVAEQKLFDYLHYDPAPRYYVETLPYPRYLEPTLYRWAPIDVTGRFLSVETTAKHVRAIGQETRAVIQAGAAIVYSKTYAALAHNDIATITVATTVTDPDQIEVYFATADRFDGSTIPATGDTGDAARFLIRPLTVRISGGVATITGPAWLFVTPVLYEAGEALNAATASNFATTVDVYRRTTNPDGTTTDTSQAVLIWESSPCGDLWWCCDASGVLGTDPAATAVAVARAGIRDSRRGIVAPGGAVYDTTAASWSGAAFAAGFEPDRVLIRYRAGLPLINGQMQASWQTTVARLAMAELSERLLGCETASRELWRWQFDLARSAGANDEQYGAISAQDLDNPIGTRRGQVEAWKQIRNLRIMSGVVPG